MYKTNSEDTSRLLFMLLEYEHMSKAPWTSWRVVITVRLPVYERFFTHFIGS